MVDGKPRDDRRQIRARRRNVRVVDPRPSQVSLLDDVVGFGRTSEHPVSNSEKDWAQLHELGRSRHDQRAFTSVVTGPLTTRSSGILQLSENPSECSPSPALNLDLKFSRATHPASSTISASEKCS